VDTMTLILAILPPSLQVFSTKRIAEFLGPNEHLLKINIQNPINS